MRRIIRLGAGISLLMLAIPALQAADKPIAIELSKFEFKVPDNLKELFGYNEGESKLFFYTNGAGTATVDVPADGEYEITVKASCTKAEKEFAKFKLSADGKQVGKETTCTTEDEKEYTLTTNLKKGQHKISIEFTNDVYKENEYDRNLFVSGVSVKKK